MEKSSHLDCDGISDSFFDLLWTKDELNFGPDINIPDSIIFRTGQPVTWYFTSSKGKIKRKSRQNMVLAKIEQSFMKHSLGYDVIATFISSPELDVDGNILPSVVQFLDQKAFFDFLYDHTKSNTGILQRFIEPIGIKNEVIRAMWSPKICLLERYENIHQLHDHRFGLYERCITYEGPDYFSKATPIRGPVLAGQIQRYCESIVSHISEVTFGQVVISRIVLNFKVDSRDKIWLLHTTSIRTIPSESKFSLHENNKRTLINIDGAISLPKTIHLNANPSYAEEKVSIRDNQILCVSCGVETIESLRHPITYKSIIKHYDHILQLITEYDQSSSSSSTMKLRWPPDPTILDAAGGVGFGCLEIVTENMSPRTDSLEQTLLRKIPPIIRFLHPKLTWKSYAKCRNDPLFLYKTVNICENCFLVYAEFMTMLLRLNGDLSALLGPEPSAAATTAPASMQRSSRGEGEASFSSSRPRSSEWRAMSALHRSRSEPSRVLEGNISGIVTGTGMEGFYKNSSVISQPMVPDPIRRGGDATQSLRRQERSDISSYETRQGQGLTKSSTTSKLSLYDPNEIRTMINERERHFFNEIAKNPQLKEQHPLMHLITAQKKLNIADQQSGIKTTSSPKKSERLFSTKYGLEPLDRLDKFGSYKEELAVNASTLRTEHSKKRSLKNIRNKSSVSSINQTASTASLASEAGSAHMEYLRNILSRLDEESTVSQKMKTKSKSEATLAPLSATSSSKEI
eukprot:gene320-580_t